MSRITNIYIKTNRLLLKRGIKNELKILYDFVALNFPPRVAWSFAAAAISFGSNIKGPESQHLLVLVDFRLHTQGTGCRVSD